MNTQDVIHLIRSAETPEQIRIADKAAIEFLHNPESTVADIAIVRQAKSEFIDAMLTEHELEQQEALRYIALNGKKYLLDDWLTPVEYARRYGLRSANNVTIWMMRGIIPADDILEIPEFNGLRLVCNRRYKDNPLTVKN